jgi:hypothetical protein
MHLIGYAYPNLWIGLKYNYSTMTYVWEDGTDLGHCDQIRVTERFDPRPQIDAGTGADCYAAYFDGQFKHYRFTRQNCSSTVAATVCKGTVHNPLMVVNWFYNK